ncbi:DUF4435 domain-containing protein [Paenibacillus sp. 8b26]|uniref:DUF4435 domain-containing protein n=1 Tax=Paenibacillus sp. 8b26 TaxID=3424133 RepID=UPI003D65148D
MSRINRALDMLNKLSEEPVGYHRFMLKYKKSIYSPICLVEGIDSKYYRVRVKSLCEGIEPEFVVCGGKKGVIDTHGLIREIDDYKEAKIFAFVDRDFDSILENENIYETPCYSIENLYTTLDVIKTILIDELKVDEVQDVQDYNTCVEFFIKAQSSFHVAITELNAWIACQRDLSSSGLTTRLNLNDKENVIMNSFFDIKLDNVTKLYSIAKIESLFPDAQKIPETQLAKKIKDISHLDAQKTYRGKYELVFLKEFLKKLVNELNRKNSSIFSKKRKIDFQVSNTNLISQISQYAETPNCLIDYVKKMWKGNFIELSV